MKRKNKLIIFIIITIVIIILILSTLSYQIINIRKNKSNSEIDGDKNSNQVTTATNYLTSYYTLNSGKNATELQSRNEIFCIFDIVDNYITKIEQSDDNGLMNIIDKDFINNNNITNQNVMSLFNSYELPYYLIKKISYVENQNYIVRFIDGSSINSDDYDTHIICIKLDQKNKSYSICPQFDDTSTDNEIYLEDKTIEKNNDNGYTINNVNDEEVGVYFVKLFKNICDNDIEHAYEIISNDETNQIKSEDELKSFMNNITINYQNINVKATSSTRYVTFEVTDGNNNYFKFNVYPNYIDFSTKIGNDTTKGDYSNIYNDYTGSVTSEEISNFLDYFVNTTVKQINDSTSGKSYNKIRQYYDNNKTTINNMGIYSADDYLNLSNQIVGMRWSKGIQFIQANINNKTEENGYIKYDLTMEYTLDEEINLYLCIAKDSTTTPSIKIETTGVQDEE